MNRLSVTTDRGSQWKYSLLVLMVSNNKPNIINLTRDSDTELHVDFTKEMLPVNGRYIMQFEYTDGNVVGHTDKFDAFVNDVINTEDTWVDIPSEFEQLRQEIMQNAIIAQNAANEAKKISQEIKVESDKATQAAKDAQQYAQQAQQAVDLTQEAQRLAQEANQAAQEAKNQAVLSATEAEQSATQASQSKAEAAESATQANQAKVEAEESATQASQSATQANLSKDEAKKAQLASEKARDESQAILEQIQSIKVEVDGIVAQINDARDKALQDIETNKNSAVESVNNAGTNNVANVNQAGATQVEAVNDTGVKQVQAITNEGNKQVGLVASEGTKQVQAVTTEGTNQLQSIRNEGSKQVQSITTEGTTQVKNVSDEGGKQVQAVTAQGETQTNLVVAEGTKQVGLVNTAGQEQVKAVNDAGTIQTANAKEQADRAKTEADRAEKAADGVQDIASSIDRLAIHETAEGNPVTIKDSADWQMEGLRVYGQSEQVTTTGKNVARIDGQLKKADLGAIDNTTKRILNPGEYTVGLTMNNFYYPQNVTDLVLSDGAVRFKNSKRGYGVGIGVSLIEGEQYIPSAKSKAGSLCVIFYREDGTHISYSGFGQPFVVPSGARYSVLLVRDDENGVVDLDQIQLERGNLATSYEPYTGGKPAPSPEYPQEIASKPVDEIVVTGANLLDCSTTKSNVGNVDIRFDGSILLVKNKNTYAAIVDIPITLNAGTYYMSVLSTTVAVPVYVANKWFANGVSSSVKRATIKIAESGVYNARITVGAQSTATIDGLMISVVDAPYEPYHAQTVKLSAPVTLRGVPVTSGGNVTINGQQYMADLITERDGVVGVERWVKWLELPVAEMNNSESLPGWKGKGFTENLSNSVRSMTTHLPKNAISLNFKYDILFFHTSGLTQSEWKSKHPDVVIGAVVTLEAPTFEPLPETDQQAIRALRTYHGNTVVTTGAHTEVDYIADPKLYIDNKIKELSAAIVAR